MTEEVRRDDDHAHAWQTRSSHHTLDGLVRYQHCACGRWRISLATEAANEIGPPDTERRTGLDSCRPERSHHQSPDLDRSLD